MKPAHEVDKKKLIEMVTELNDSGLLPKTLRTVAVKHEILLSNFVDAISNLGDKANDLPEAMILFYNELIADEVAQAEQAATQPPEHVTGNGTRSAEPPKDKRYRKRVDYDNPSALLYAMMVTVENPDITVEQVMQKLEVKGLKASANSVSMQIYDAKRTIAYIRHLNKWQD